MKNIVYFFALCDVVLFACVFYLRFSNPTMTETQLFMSFLDVYSLVVFGIVLSYFGLIRCLK